VPTRATLVQTFLENKQNAYTVAFAPSGTRFAAAGGLRSAFVYDVDKPEAIGGVADHKQSVYAMLFSKSGKFFITTGRDGMVIIYDAQTFDKLTTILCPQIGQRFIATSFDYKAQAAGAIFAADEHGIVHVQDSMPVFESVEYVFHDIQKTDEKTLRATSVIRKVFDAAGKIPDVSESLYSNNQLLPNYALALNPDESLLYVGASGGWLKVYRTSDWNLVNLVRLHDGNIRALAISPDGKYLATGSSDHFAKIHKTETLQTLHTIEGLTGGKDARLRVWSVDGDTIKPKVKILAHTFSIKSMAFLNGGKNLITTSQDKTIKFWDIASATLLETVDRNDGGHTFTINSIAVSTDETFFVTGSDDKTVKLWKLNT
jgi:WD40 repeat protein